MATIERAPPAAALAELKAYLRIEGAHEEALLSGLLRAATETVEAMLGQLLFEREVAEHGVVCGGWLALGFEPARSLVVVEQLDSAGVASPLPEGAARLQVGRYGEGRVQLSGAGDGSELRVRYRAGIAADWNGVPEVLRLSVIRAAAHFHAHRDRADDAGVPPVVRRLLAPWRVRRVR